MKIFYIIVFLYGLGQLKFLLSKKFWKKLSIIRKREMIQDLLALKEKKCCINRDYIPNEIDTRIIKDVKQMIILLNF